MLKAALSKEYEAFQRILRETRKKHGLTQLDVAERLGMGITQSDVSKIERGERRLDVAEFVLFVRALGVPPQAVLAEFERAIPERPLTRS